MPSALLHAVISGLSDEDTDPLQHLAATLPDTVGTKDAHAIRNAEGMHASVIAGLAHHDATDRALHEHPDFRTVVDEAKEGLKQFGVQGHRLSLWLPHIGTEFLLDSFATQDPTRVEIFRRSLATREELLALTQEIPAHPRVLRRTYERMAAVAAWTEFPESEEHTLRSIAGLCKRRSSVSPNQDWQSWEKLQQNESLRNWIGFLADRVAAHRDKIVTDVIEAVR
jgi:hypothetical protein